MPVDGRYAIPPGDIRHLLRVNPTLYARKRKSIGNIDVERSSRDPSDPSATACLNAPSQSIWAYARFQRAGYPWVPMLPIRRQDRPYPYLQRYSILTQTKAYTPRPTFLS